MMRRLIAVVTLSALVVAACSGSGESDEGTDGIVAPNPERFCEINAQLDLAPDFFVESADEAASNARTFISLYDESSDTAPVNIRSSVLTTVMAYKTVISRFDTLDYDVSQFTDEDLEPLGTDEFRMALDVVNSWLEANC